MCVDMGGGGFTLSGKVSSQGVLEKGGSRGVHKKGGSQGRSQKRGSREPCEPPPLATGLPIDLSYIDDASSESAPYKHQLR